VVCGTQTKEGATLGGCYYNVGLYQGAGGHLLVESGVQQPQLSSIEAKPWDTCQRGWEAAREIVKNQRFEYKIHQNRYKNNI
jgi:hypothetical protein